MILRLSCLLALALPLALVGCRRKSPQPPVASEAEPIASASASSQAANACPPDPAWAEELPADAIVEVLHLPAKRANRNGAGYRLFEDGRFQTYTDVELFVNDAGKLDTRPGDAVWKTMGGVEGAKLEATRKLVLESPREELESWAPKRKPKDLDIDATLVRLRANGEIVRSCYFGDRAPPPLGAIERAVHDLGRGIKKTGPKDETKARDAGGDAKSP